MGIKPSILIKASSLSAVLPPLYARGANGGILKTEFEIVSHKFRTITGLMDGARTASGWVTCGSTNVGRSNERSASEQAIFEARARWKKKQEQEGYKLSINAIDEGAGFVEPMLAYPLEKHPNLKFPVMLDRKYNGMRCILTKDGMFSRKGKPIVTAPHIYEAARELFVDSPLLVLDGELYNHSYRYKLNELLSIVKKQKPTVEDLEESEKIVKYYVYDGYGFGSFTENTGCLDRRLTLYKLLGGFSRYIDVVEYFNVKDQKELMTRYEGFVADGYEGAIIRNPDAPYQHKRTKDLLKLKPNDDAEGIITAIHEGNGAWTGCAKTATLLWKGKKFDATFKCTQEQAQGILRDRRSWMFERVTFKYNGLTGKGIPNFAQIDPNNCKEAH